MADLRKLFAAQYVLGLVHSYEMSEHAQQLLDAGYCTPSIAAFISVHGPVSWDVEFRYRTIFKELGVAFPPRDSALWTVLRHQVRSIIDGPHDPLEDLNRAWRDFISPVLDTGDSLRTAFDIDEFWSCCWEQDYLFEPPGYLAEAEAQERLRELREQVLSAAVTWNRKHSDPFDPALLTWNDATIPRLARAIYDEHAYDRLPILADALEEAGCTDLDILNHCRGPGPHVRGCWVIDLLLGRA